MSKPYILCVDDESTILDALIGQLKVNFGESYFFEQAESGEEALVLLDEIMALKREVALVISDQMMPNMKGHDLLTRVHKASPSTLTILLPGITTTEELGIALNEAKLYRYITKPWEKYDLQMTVQEALKTYQQRAEISQNTQLLELLVSGGQAMAKEMDARGLSESILNFLTQGSNADRGGLVIYGDHEQVLHQLFFEKEGGEFKFNQNAERYPTHLIGAVGKCDEPILVHTPNTNTLVTDAYIEEHKPRSIYCRPLWHGNILVGLIYLESNVRKNNFNSSRIRFIELLSQYAAVSIGRLKVFLGLEQAVETRTAEINMQKKIIENKNKDLLDSIHYARRLQTNFMPPSEYLQKMFSNAMLIYKPKSIVSGDFYWWRDTEKYSNVAIVDCTGHGVPGGMLSILGLNLLNHLMVEEGLHHPDEVLLRMNQYFHQRLASGEFREQEANMLHYDGMDLALITLHKTTGRLEFSGARRPLFLVRKGELTVIKGENCSLGGNTIRKNTRQTFKRETLQLEPDDQVYMFSDGLVDQFGGSRNRKFTPKRFREILLEYAGAPMELIKREIEKTHEAWRGNNEQTDDILVLGISYQPQEVMGQRPQPLKIVLHNYENISLRQAI